jgi:hypothetical protein
MQLSELCEDRRNVYAAELAIAAWKAHERSTLGRHNHDPPTNQLRQRPSFLQELDAALHEYRNINEATGGDAVQPITAACPRLGDDRVRRSRYSVTAALYRHHQARSPGCKRLPQACLTWMPLPSSMLTRLTGPSSTPSSMKNEKPRALRQGEPQAPE